MKAQIDVFFVDCAHFFLFRPFLIVSIFAVYESSLYCRDYWFWRELLCFDPWKTTSFFIEYLHFKSVCGILLAGVYIICFGELFSWAVSHLFSRYWTGLKRKWQFFLGIYKHSFSLTAAHSQSLVFLAILWIIPS